ncbi:MAG: hypothetical protein ACXWA3_04840 [Acidimicrobiales bacterium]
MKPHTVGRRAARRARDGGDSLLRVLQRLVPLARYLVGAVRLLIVASLASIVIIAAVVLAHGVPSLSTGGLLVIVLGLLVPAPVILWMFHGALREALALPEWLRSSPDIAKGHAAELADLVTAARRPTSGARGHLLRDTFRAGRLLLEAHDDLPGYGALLRLVSPFFLVLVLVASVAAMIQVGLALAVVATDLVLRLVL